METYTSLHQIVAKINQSQSRIITSHVLAILFPAISRQGRYEMIQRMIRKKIISKIIHGIYEFTDKPLSAFEKAQAIDSNSYISLESALNYYGILSQFPHMVTSVTSGKTNTKESTQTYEYIHIKPDLYTDFQKIDGFLIATKEKAVADYLYLASKGLRSNDIAEFDLKNIDTGRLAKYPWCQKYVK